MNLRNFKIAMVSIPSAILSSLCCLLPLLVISLGLGSGAFMIYTMKYSYIFIPLGVAGVIAGYILFFREMRRCDATGCRMAGRTVNLIFLMIATMIVTIVILLQIFPEFTASFITGAA